MLSPLGSLTRDLIHGFYISSSISLLPFLLHKMYIFLLSSKTSVANSLLDAGWVTNIQII